MWPIADAFKERNVLQLIKKANIPPRDPGTTQTVAPTLSRDYNTGLGRSEKDETCLKSKGWFSENVSVRLAPG